MAIAGIGRVCGILLATAGGVAAAIWLPAAVQIAVDRSDRLREPEGPAAAALLDRMGLAAETGGRSAEAEDYYRRALRIREATLGPRDLATVQSWLRLGGVHHTQGDDVRAERYMNRALSIAEQPTALGEPTWPLARLGQRLRGDGGRSAQIDQLRLEALDGLGSLHRKAGRLEQAQPIVRRAVELAEKPSILPAARATVFANAGLLAHDLGAYEEADRWHQRALEALPGASDGNDVIRAGIWNNLASTRVAQHRYAEARESLARARDLLGHAAPTHTTLPELVAANAANLDRLVGAERRASHPEP